MNPIFKEERLAAHKTDKAHAEPGGAADSAASDTDNSAALIAQELRNETMYDDRIARALKDKGLAIGAEEDQEIVGSAPSAATAASLERDVAAADAAASLLALASSSPTVVSHATPARFYTYSADEAHLPPRFRKITTSTRRSQRERKKAVIGHVAPTLNAKKSSKPKAKKAVALEDEASNGIPPGTIISLSCGKRTVRTVTQDADDKAIEASDDMGPESEDELEHAVKPGKAAKGKAATAAKSKAAKGPMLKAAATAKPKAQAASKPKRLEDIVAPKVVPAAKPKARSSAKRARDEVDDDDVPQEDARPAKARKTATKARR
ncbi:uncharacterized protein SCHCODRAFT_01354708 [Schizophyllum commune H4-8]|uniref:Uncharacterized protein n=1 Tax=Schizophyllum commune (strain H4-8 / FGSC 9210) TaxID=578458 RepID=D8Q7C5_SCHCM|nr:uncharacterized protein SCHCODRAFT_01354708 [Schizophyllum commune H4-8]KAI5891553.1 hypothetical protein SCHCODRAFT_01354708 [Schizophyllum commune H4-8]